MTDPNVLGVLNLLVGRVFRNESSPERTQAYDLLLAAAEKPTAPVVPPALPWVVRWVASKKEIARCDAESDARTLRDLYVTSAVEVAPAAPAIVPVAFDATGSRSGNGWFASTREGTKLFPAMVGVQIDLRPGEDAGVLLAKLLAAGGRGP